jgi:hypothetical protein
VESATGGAQQICNGVRIMKKQIKPTWDALRGRIIQQVVSTTEELIIILDNDEYIVLVSCEDYDGCAEAPMIIQHDMKIGLWMVDVGICTDKEFIAAMEIRREDIKLRQRERELAELARLKEKYEGEKP